MKNLIIFLGLGLIALPVVTLARVSHANAKVIVVCGPNGAARTVEKVPAGCHILKTNTPPGQK